MKNRYEFGAARASGDAARERVRLERKTIAQSGALAPRAI